LVEHAAMTLAALAGIFVAAIPEVRLSGLNAVAICSFDRKIGGGQIHSVETPSQITKLNQIGGRAGAGARRRDYFPNPR
jgi:serine/threonine-protein kinase HipA